MESIPRIRIRVLNDVPPDPAGDYVLYWMLAHRRTTWNFGLERAVHWARELGKPLVVFEAIRCEYRWASDRLHRFVLQDMRDNARRLEKSPVLYYPYVEPEPDAGKGLLAALGARASAVVTDEYPAFELPRMLSAARRQIPSRLEAIDSNGLLPLRMADKAYPTAYSFRRFLQKTLPECLRAQPAPNPLARRRLPRLHRLAGIEKRWPPPGAKLLEGGSSELSALPLDHAVIPVATRGGTSAARATLRRFLDRGLERYAAERNEPDKDATSNLSPYLHFGHVSAHEVLAAVASAEDWTPDLVGPEATGARHGWWGMSEAAEGFLDQLVTWRELGFNMCLMRADHDRFESLPAWAAATLAEHAADPRPHLYDLEQLESAETHDPLWNAVQTQLVREGRLHNYMRMLWGKKILEWSAGPERALEIMIELNNKYALDGRDPNSYSGIFWTLGRYDRPWGPERPIFGKVRYMSSENTARKLRVGGYIERYRPDRD